MLFMVYYSLTHIQNLVMGTEWDSNMDIHQFHPLSYFLSLLIPFLGQTNLFFTKRHSPSILVFIPYLSTSKINIRKVWYIMLRTLFWSLTTNHRDSTDPIRTPKISNRTSHPQYPIDWPCPGVQSTVQEDLPSEPKEGSLSEQIRSIVWFNRLTACYFPINRSEMSLCLDFLQLSQSYNALNRLTESCRYSQW